MILIEIGNSSVKAVKVTASGRKYLFKVHTNQPSALRKELSELADGETVFFSSVRKEAAEIIKENSDRLSIYQITPEKPGKIKLDYDTPESLGVDRVLACLGATMLADGKDVIVVDAGTACTIDFMTRDYIFRGGVIMPGLTLHRTAMKQMLPELPDVNMELPALFPGRSTEEAIQWGLFGGFINSIRVFIEKYNENSKDLALFLTGGDGELIEKELRKYFNCIYKEDIVFEGMEAFIKINNIYIL